MNSIIERLLNELPEEKPNLHLLLSTDGAEVILFLQKSLRTAKVSITYADLTAALSTKESAASVTLDENTMCHARAFGDVLAVNKEFLWSFIRSRGLRDYPQDMLSVAAVYVYNTAGDTHEPFQPSLVKNLQCQKTDTGVEISCYVGDEIASSFKFSWAEYDSFFNEGAADEAEAPLREKRIALTKDFVAVLAAHKSALCISLAKQGFSATAASNTALLDTAEEVYNEYAAKPWPDEMKDQLYCWFSRSGFEIGAQSEGFHPNSLLITWADFNESVRTANTSAVATPKPARLDEIVSELNEVLAAHLTEICSIVAQLSSADALKLARSNNGSVLDLLRVGFSAKDDKTFEIGVFIGGDTTPVAGVCMSKEDFFRTLAAANLKINTDSLFPQELSAGEPAPALLSSAVDSSLAEHVVEESSSAACSDEDGPDRVCIVKGFSLYFEPVFIAARGDAEYRLVTPGSTHGAILTNTYWPEETFHWNVDVPLTTLGRVLREGYVKDVETLILGPAISCLLHACASDGVSSVLASFSDIDLGSSTLGRIFKTLAMLHSAPGDQEVQVSLGYNRLSAIPLALPVASSSDLTGSSATDKFCNLPVLSVFFYNGDIWLKTSKNKARVILEGSEDSHKGITLLGGAKNFGDHNVFI